MSVRLVRFACVLCGSLLLSVNAGAAYPEKPLRLIVPFPAGGSLDTVGRVVSQRLGAHLGQQVIVENRPGTAGGIGSSLVAKARPDGYTLLLGTISSHAINPALYPKLPYDPQRDFAPISQVTAMPNVLVVNTATPARSLQELIQFAKANPGAVTFASGGNGTTHHLCGEMLAKAAGISLTHIPYKGNASAITDLMGGQVTMMCDNISNSLAYIEGGRLRALAVTSARRSAALPAVPTMAEAGFAGNEISSWFAVFAPANTPPEIVQKLYEAVARVMQEPQVREALAKEGIEAVGSSPAQLASLMRSEMVRWAKIVADSGARVD
jgi:tripartite-type tricarboxylate transporter receptor subunit TctC